MKCIHGDDINAKCYNVVRDVVPVNFKYKVLLNLRKQYLDLIVNNH